MLHLARPYTTRPTAMPGTKVTTRLPSGVSQETTLDVTKAAITPTTIAVRRDFDGGPAALFIHVPFYRRPSDTIHVSVRRDASRQCVDLVDSSRTYPTPSVGPVPRS